MMLNLFIADYQFATFGNAAHKTDNLPIAAALLLLKQLLPNHNRRGN
ncbi:hypothetical protein [Mucilaginibacter frigoritolerans]|nr:hypothetical protein [Mucilaginibacter frigoritolerans]